MHAALAQVETLRGDEVVVVAPLFREVVHLLARHKSEIRTMADLKSRSEDDIPLVVWIGRSESGMRVSAKAVFSRYEIDTKGLDVIDCPLESLIDDDRIDVAVVTAGSHNATLRELLESGTFRLISLPNAGSLFSAHPSFRHHEIELSPVPTTVAQNTRTVVDSVATVAVLAVRKDETGLLVTTLIDLLYSNDEIGERYGLIAKEDAAVWVRILDVHPSAREFFANQP